MLDCLPARALLFVVSGLLVPDLGLAQFGGARGDGAESCVEARAASGCPQADASARSDSLATGKVLHTAEIERFHPATSLLDMVHGSLPGAYSLDLGARNDLYRTLRVRGPVGFPVCSSCGPRILIEGVETNPVTPSLVSANNLASISVAGLSRGYLFGTDAAGGVLSLDVRKKGTTQGNRVRGGASIGDVTSSHPREPGLYESYFASVEGLFESGGYSVAVARSIQPDHVPEYGATSTSASAGFVSRLASVQVSGFSRYSERRFKMPGWGSAYYGLYSDGLLPDWGRIDDNDYGRHKQLTVGLGLRYQPTVRWRIDAVMGDDIVDLETFGLPTFAPGDSMVGSQSDRYTLPSARLVSTTDLLRRSHSEASIAVGADWRHARRVGFGSYRRHSEQARTPSWRGDIFEDDYTDTGVFAETRLMVVDALHVNVGIRADRHTLFPDDLEWSINPGGSIAYAIRPGTTWTLTPRAAWGRGVTAPSLAMRAGEAPGISPNAALEPQLSEGWEAGLDGSALDGRLAVGATFYAQRTTGVFDLLLNDAGEPAIYSNAGTIRTSGQELYARWTSGPATLSGSFLFIDVEQERDPSRLVMVDREEAVPSRVASLSGAYALARWLGRPSEVGARIVHLGSRTAYDPRSYFEAQKAGEAVGQTIGAFDPVTRADFYLRGTLARHLELRLDARNLLDSAIQDVPEIILPGRELHVTLEAHF